VEASLKFHTLTANVNTLSKYSFYPPTAVDWSGLQEDIDYTIFTLLRMERLWRRKCTKQVRVLASSVRAWRMLCWSIPAEAEGTGKVSVL